MKNILMNKDMTKAILDGRKVQTRRIVKKIEIEHIAENKTIWAKFQDGKKCIYEMEDLVLDFAKYQIGEIIWVREPARVSLLNTENGKLMFEYLADDGLKPTDKRYKVNLYDIKIPERFTKGFGKNCDEITAKWIIKKQGIPNGCIKEMARIFLKITNVRVERLQDISDEDCLAEGIEKRHGLYKNYIDGTKGFISDKQYDYCGRRFSGIQLSFFTLISSTEALVQSNPYVFVYEFERVDK